MIPGGVAIIASHVRVGPSTEAAGKTENRTAGAWETSRNYLGLARGPENRAYLRTLRERGEKSPFERDRVVVFYGAEETGEKNQKNTANFGLDSFFCTCYIKCRIIESPL